MRRRDVCLSMLAAAGVFTAGAEARSRRLRVRAISISNSYENVAWPDALGNADDDGKQFAATAVRLPYTRSVTAIRNATYAALEQQLNDILVDLREGDTVLFHYAGHAVQFAGGNYLVTDDGKDLVNIQSLFEAFSGGGTRPVIAFLDCCRDNPFADEPQRGVSQTFVVHRGLRVGTRSADGPETELSDDAATAAYEALAAQAREKNGLTEFDLGDANIFVMFATSPRRTARDFVNESDRHSPFTAALAKHMPKKVGLNELAQLISRDVSESTAKLGDERQIPWRSASLQGAEIFLAGRPRYGGGLVQ